MMFELTDESLVALEQIVGGKVHSISYDPRYLTCDVKFKRDGRSELEEKKVSSDLIRDVIAGRIDLDGLRKD